MLTASFLQIVAFCHWPLPFSANEACAFRCCDTHAPQQTLEVQTKQTCAALDGSSTEMKQGTEHQSLVGVRVCVCVCEFVALSVCDFSGWANLAQFQLFIVGIGD